MDREAMIAALIFGGSGSGGGSGAEVFVTTISYSAGGYLANHSASEIQTAYAAGKLCYAVYTDSGDTFVFQLAGIKTNYAYFSRAIKFSSNNATITTLEVSNSGIAGFYAVTRSASILVPAPLIVNYTITGAPVGITYPLSADKTLSEMLAAKAEGREVISRIVTQDGTLEAPCTFYDASAIIMFSTVISFNNAYAVLEAQTIDSSGSDLSLGHIVPISTAQMTYDSGTGTLAITE